MIKRKEYTLEEKTEWLRSKQLYAYDQAKRAKSIIIDAHYKAHPQAHKGPRDGICHCGKPIDYGESYIFLNEHGREYHSHKTCDSWACPICAPKRASARATEIEAALLNANRKGYKQYFITFTVPHKKRHSTRFVIDRLNACYNRLYNRQSMRRMRSQYGFVGQIKCLDYTLTDNGTHAHLHTIWMFDSDLDLFELARCIAPEFIGTWDSIVFKESGQHINQKHGINIEVIELGDPKKPSTTALAKYTAKAISIYTSDAEGKKSITPFNLLKANASEAEKERFLDFYKGQKGRQHIVFSRGLKDHLGVDDYEYLKPEQVMVAQVDYEHIWFLSDENQRQEFERMCNASVDMALDWLEHKTDTQQRFLAKCDDRPHRPKYVRPQRFREVIDDLDDFLNDRAVEVRKHAKQQASWEDYVQEQHYLGLLAFYERLKQTPEYASRMRNLERLKRNAEKARKKGLKPISGVGEVLAKINDQEAESPFDESLFFGPVKHKAPSVASSMAGLSSLIPIASRSSSDESKRYPQLFSGGAVEYGFDPFSDDFDDYGF